MIGSFDLSAEEFAAKRRGAQDRLIETLTPIIAETLRHRDEDEWSDPIEAALRAAYEAEYAAEGGEGEAKAEEFVKRIEPALEKASPDSKPQTMAVALAIATINAAAVQAATDDPEDLFMEWVTMHDEAVRPEHKRTDGQVRPIGEPYDVDGVEMSMPGDVRAPIELWINCRCTLRPRLATGFATSKSLTAAGGNMDGAIPWHGVLAPENVWSGDKRKFAEGALSHRPLPLPLTWQKISDDGHKGNVTVAMIEDIQMIDGLMHGSGHFISNAEADEVVGLLGEFGRFGVSIDADDATFELDEEEGGVVFTRARASSACIVPIPAFAEAWVALGQAPWMKPKDEDEEEGEGTQDAPADAPAEKDPAADEPGAVRDDAPEPPADGEEDEEKRKRPPVPVKSALEQMRLRANRFDQIDWSDIEEFVDVSPGKTEDGPGWLTHPVDTDRLRDYWVRGPGAAKIAWGSPGDFNRCRMQVAKYIKPQHLNGYCANRHFDALGFWPGRPVSGETTIFAAEVMGLEDTEAAPAINLVASAAQVDRYKADWFAMAEPEADDPRMVDDGDGPGVPFTITDDGQVYGHVARWNACHIDNPMGPGVCTGPPMSVTGYREFHQGAAPLDNGTTIPAGVITVGGGHATLDKTLRAAKEHYDDVSTAVAHVVATDGKFGIWVCGSITPWATREQIAMARSAPVSGDWREDRTGNPEMIAVHAVNTNGFRQPRIKIAASGEHVKAMVASTAPEAPVPAQAGIDMEALADVVTRQVMERFEAKKRMAALAARRGIEV